MSATPCAWAQMWHLHFLTFSGIEHASPSYLAPDTKVAGGLRWVLRERGAFGLIVEIALINLRLGASKLVRSSLTTRSIPTKFSKGRLRCKLLRSVLKKCPLQSIGLKRCTKHKNR